MNNGNHDARPPGRRTAKRSETLVSTGAVLIVIGLLTLILYLYLFNTKQDMIAQSPGGCAKDYLSDEQYSEMRVEIDYVRNYDPHPWSLNAFESKINKYVRKNTIDIDPDNNFTLQGSVTPQSLESEYRDYYTDGNTAVLYILYVSGEYQGEENVAGVTYSCSSIVIFKEKIRDNIPLQDPDYVEHRRIAEANILLHEFGHIVGLVNELDYNFGYDQEDNEHPNHNKNQTSVMYYEADFTALQDFDEADVADLNAIRALPVPSPDPLLYYGLLVLVVAGAIIAAVGGALRVKERKEIAKMQASEAQTPSAAAPTAHGEQYQNLCPNCRKPATFISMYGRWYCYSCRKCI